jgi:hypothetical protein
MKRKMMLVVAALAVVTGAAAAKNAWTVSGTFTHSGVKDGTMAYIKLVDPGPNCLNPEPADYATEATFKGGKATYTLEDVYDGEYTACAFIDLVRQEGVPRPDSGDPAAVQDLEVRGHTTLDFDEDAWRPFP